VTILDADLTRAGVGAAALLQRLPRWARRFHQRRRLVYGTEAGAMRALNTMGNVLFAKALSYVLSVRLGRLALRHETVCAPGLCRFTHGARFRRLRSVGDFEMLFPRRSSDCR